MKRNDEYKLGLRSDFSDYYDHHFDRVNPHLDHGRHAGIWHRKSRDQIDRRSALKLLADIGYRVPAFGTPASLRAHAHLNGWDLVVVHTDPFAHCGDGKERMKLEQAEAEHPDALAVEYIVDEDGFGNGRSLRHLRIGSRIFYLLYTSKSEDWRSNAGDVEIKVLGDGNSDGPGPLAGHACCAVGLVYGLNGLVAVDFNGAPGLSPIKHLMPAADVVREIKAVWEAKARGCVTQSAG